MTLEFLPVRSPQYTAPQKWWNQERIDYLIKRWGEGASASQVGGELHITRNAIIGKVHRLHLPLRRVRIMSPEAKAKKAEKSGKPKMKRHAPPGFVPKPVFEPMPLELIEEKPPLIAPPVAFMDLEERHCRFIVGKSMMDGLALYCGVDKVDGSPYCARHTKQCYNPTQR